MSHFIRMLSKPSHSGSRRTMAAVGSGESERQSIPKKILASDSDESHRFASRLLPSATPQPQRQTVAVLPPPPGWHRFLRQGLKAVELSRGFTQLGFLRQRNNPTVAYS